MAIVATLETVDGALLSLDKFSTDLGRVPDVVQMVEEELTAPGVDGRRFRDVSDRFVPFTVQTLETCPTYANAVTKCRTYDGMVGTICKLTVVVGGSTYRYDRVHVMSATARAMPGAVAGAASAATHAAYVLADLSLVLMESTSGANP